MKIYFLVVILININYLLPVWDFVTVGPELLEFTHLIHSYKNLDEKVRVVCFLKKYCPPPLKENHVFSPELIYGCARRQILVKGFIAQMWEIINISGKKLIFLVKSIKNDKKKSCLLMSHLSFFPPFHQKSFPTWKIYPGKKL